MNKIRINVYVDESLRQYIEQQAGFYGMSMSAFIAMCIAEHRRQNKALDVLGSIVEELKKKEGANDEAKQ
jgi:hypothetical protein